ncbi:NAD(P)H-dependent oxidoreductase [Escherichia coli]|uniref:NAD(P)H-dependent oxidoreductase n=1 Tax=Escherichia coli TaxID=562 RepID=UPI001FCE7DB9|nr:NAD(P)H-dependent oxidoreductase [Escherichia coli]
MDHYCTVRDIIFPTHWFNITPMMKAWLNETWGSVGPGLWPVSYTQIPTRGFVMSVSLL